ncbi:MAG: AIR carboxylase family protein [Gemmiger formicilis]|uniref:AIR carboxylase family protein n=1 Tax=Gemmiger formicilis TaxID=745368 RepID=UPI003A38C34A
MRCRYGGLAFAFAANTTLPVVGIPMRRRHGRSGRPAAVQMPRLPVATVALNGQERRVSGVAILAVADDELAASLTVPRRHRRRGCQEGRRHCRRSRSM